MSVPLSELVKGARSHANMRVGGPLSSTDWDAAINRAVEYLYSRATKVCPSFRVKIMPAATPTVAAPFLALPSDFRQVLYVVSDPGTLKRREMLRTGSVDALWAWPTYRIEDSNLYIDPLERAADSPIELHYNQLPTALTADVPLDSELAQHRDFIEWQAAIAALTTEGSSTVDAAKERDRAEAVVMEWAISQRNTRAMPIKDVRYGRIRNSPWTR